ncbi:glycosyltransferase family A protein [Streptomyces sp. FIT100]|uniref:glycosyltransferase family A protein n=1 Tax=Streptomyces sp. FIT100 TaxID=2837956 RepID=UPI0021C5F7DF|nr:glycosyltransferase family A protein [Streptomyces sp. FIT100]UUN27195.1 glycosyltransferase family 2 protein [Streptomyces sp. FIT100]
MSASGTTGTPDVTVVLSARGPEPRLTRSLDSLAGQTLELDRIEVLLVGDGPAGDSPVGDSLAGGGLVGDGPAGDEAFRDACAAEQLERFSASHPATVGAAVARARGRYLLFLRSGDFLGREALTRLVDAADIHGSDVVYAKTAGATGALFARTGHRVPHDASGLPWELSGTKLFRREPVERHGLRFADEIPAAFAVQAFTLEALFRARGISVLADYDYCFASRASNTDTDTDPAPGIEDLLRGTAAAMAVTARFTEPGRLRDGFHHRHFARELDPLTGPALLDVAEPVRRRVFAGLRRLVTDHLSDAVLTRLPPGLRLRLSYVRAGDLPGLVSVVRYEAGHGVPPLRTDLVSAGWRRTGPARHTLVLTARSPLPGLGALAEAPVRLTGTRPGAGRIVLRPAPDGCGTEIEVRIPADAFPPGRTRFGLRTALLGTEHQATVPAGAPPRRAHGLRGLRPYRLHVAADGTRGLVVAVAPLGRRQQPRSAPAT